MEPRQAGDTSYHKFQDDDGDLFREGIRDHICAIVSEDIKVGCYGAVVTIDKDADGYYLVKWTGTPYTDQETGELVCDGLFLNPVGRARKWYTLSSLLSRSLVKHVVLAKVVMEGITDQNQLPKACNRRQAAAKGALKISKASDDFIFAETYRRDQLEDPVREDELEDEN